MSARTLAANAFWSLVGHVLHRGSLMLGAILLARNLATDGFAAYSYFQMTVSMLATYAALGLGVTASRYFAEFGHEGAGSPAPVGTLLAGSLFLALAAFLLILLLPAGWLDAGMALPQWLIALGVAVTVVSIVPGGGILGLEKYRAASLVSLVSGLWMLALTGLAARQQSPLLGMWAIISSQLIQTLGQLLVIARCIGWQAIAASCRWSAQEVRRLAGFAGPMFIVSILAGSGTWIVGRMILADSGDREFAVYAIGLQWFALGSLLPGMVSRVVLPRLVRDRGQDNRRLVRTGLLMALLPAAVFVIFGYLVASWLISFYGDLYADYALVIPAFLCIAAFNAPINTIGNGIVAKDGQKQWLAMSITVFIFLIGSLALFPHATAWWSVASHMLSTAAMLGMVVIAGRKRGLI